MWLLSLCGLNVLLMAFSLIKITSHKRKCYPRPKWYNYLILFFFAHLNFAIAKKNCVCREFNFAKLTIKWLFFLFYKNCMSINNWNKTNMLSRNCCWGDVWNGQYNKEQGNNRKIQDTRNCTLEGAGTGWSIWRLYKNCTKMITQMPKKNLRRILTPINI